MWGFGAVLGGTAIACEPVQQYVREEGLVASNRDVKDQRKGTDRLPAGPAAVRRGARSRCLGTVIRRREAGGEPW